MSDATLTTKEAARYLRLSIHTVLAYRQKQLHLPYYKDTNGHITYLQSDLDAFLATRPAPKHILPVRIMPIASAKE